MGNGQIRVAGDLDYETFSGSAKKFSLIVTATDNGSPPLSNTQTVVVELVDINEAPVITGNQKYDVDENTQNQKIGEIFYTDQDSGANGIGTFAIISGNKYSDEATSTSYVVFELSTDTLEIWATSDADIDYEKSAGYSVVVQLTDGGNLKVRFAVLFCLFFINRPHSNLAVVSVFSFSLIALLDFFFWCESFYQGCFFVRFVLGGLFAFS